MKTVTVYCGSRSGSDDAYGQEAYALGRLLASMDINLVYGGAAIGLMGAVADGVLQNGGKVTGVIPSFLRIKEVAHEGLSELVVVESMHERKALMNSLCDGFIALPGGFGTLEELFEMLTWTQLGLHGKPVGLLNINGYYDHLLLMLDAMVNQGFLSQSNRNLLLAETDAGPLLQRMLTYQPPDTGKWLTEATV